MNASTLIDGLRGAVRRRVGRVLDPLVRPRISELLQETTELRSELVEARDRVDELTVLVERLDGLLGERQQ